MILAQSLRTNTTLRRLNVTHDEIREKVCAPAVPAANVDCPPTSWPSSPRVVGGLFKLQGAFVLADMLKENKGLQDLILSENPIGQRGGRAILRAISRMVDLGTASLVGAPQSTRNTQTVPQHDGPNYLGLWLNGRFPITMAAFTPDFAVSETSSSRSAT